MKTPRIAIPTVFVLALLAGRPLEAQATPKPSEAPKEEAFVSEKGFANRIFEVKHRDPNDLWLVLRPLGSGYRGATMLASREFKTLTVRDFPENIAAVEAALKRLDVAEAARTDVELRLWVLVASNADNPAGRTPEDLKEVVAALKSTLAYKNYALAGTFVQRVRDGARGIRGEGVTDLTSVEGKGPSHMQLEYRINTLAVEPVEKGPATLRLDGFALALQGDGRAALNTDVTLHDGEKVVVGTSTVRDRGLVVVVSAKVLR